MSHAPEPPFGLPRVPAHQLLDSGGGEKLERFGEVLLRRPDPQALWPRRRPAEWERADLVFQRESDRGGRWEAREGAHSAARGERPEWRVGHDDATLLVRPTPFRHVGLFPEQEPNWRFVRERAADFGVPRPRLLNLFGYTGAASVLAAQAGYEVTHVDASKTAIAWTRANAQASGLGREGLRVLCDDASAFARREVRRGARYHGVLMDPPHHGRGPKGETWQFERDVAPLVEAVGALLEPRSFAILTAYAIGFSPLGLRNLLAGIPGGALEWGELVLPEVAPEGEAAGGEELGPRLLPAGFCARWTRDLPRP